MGDDDVTPPTPNLFLSYLSQRIRATVNTQEQKRLLMDLDISMRTVDCFYTVTFYGALFREVLTWWALGLHWRHQTVPKHLCVLQPSSLAPTDSQGIPSHLLSLHPQGDVWICMELMDTSLDKFYKKVLEKKKTIPEDILGKMAVSVSGSWVLTWVCASPEPAGGLS